MNSDAAFCPSCGAAAIHLQASDHAADTAAVRTGETFTPQPPPAAVPPPTGVSTRAGSSEHSGGERKSFLVIAAVISLIVIAGIFWFALTGFPLERRSERSAVAERPATAVIEEGEAPESEPVSTATIRDLEQPPPLVPPTATTPAPAIESGPAAPPPAVPEAAPPAPVTEPAPAPERPQPSPPVPSRPAGEISAERATSRLAAFLRGSNFYDQSSDCIAIRNSGYRNVGYDLETYDTCSRGGTKLLDRWRVDSKTEEVFRQRSDGRYLRP